MGRIKVNQASIWLTLLGGGIITYLLRLSFILLMDKWQLPNLLQRGLRYVPPAVLSAIIFPELIYRNGMVDFSLHNLRLIAGLVAILVAWRRKNLVLAIAVGMGVLLALQWLLPKGW